MAANEPQAQAVEVRETIPLWLAVGITILVSLPFGLFLGRYNLPLWACFIVWAEYFALGGQPAALKVMLPAYAAGVAVVAASMFTTVLLAPSIGSNLALAVSLFVWCCLLVYIMRFSQTLTKGSLPYFNGVSMLLALYFTGAYPHTDNLLLQPWVAGAWAIAAGILGGFLGWFNVTITFPRRFSA